MTSKLSGRVSFKNTTNTPLSADATFTGEWEDVSSWDTVSFAVRADTTCTIYADFTSDSTFQTTDSTLTYSTTANINEVHRLSITRQFFRLRVVESSSSNQTYLSVSSMVGTHPQLSAPMNLNLGLDSDAIAVRPTATQDEIVIGRRPGVRSFTKFSHSGALTASAGEETIWAATGTSFVPMTTASTFTITFNNATDGLSTTGALSLFFDYIDENGLTQQTQVVLDGSGSQVTSFQGLGINRASIVLSGTANVNNNNITITDTTGGTTQAIIPAGEGVTQQAIFFCDANSDGIGKFLWVNVNKLSGGGAPRITIKGYVYNRQFGSQFEIYRQTIDTDSENTISLNEPIGFRLSPQDVLFFVADTDTNNAIVNLRFSLNEYKRD
jgi:hypothetical protein